MGVRYDIELSKDTTILRNCPDHYNGAGIYAIYDSNGKMYIGKARHIQERLAQHRANMNAFYFYGRLCGENDKLYDAINQGITFDCKILEKIPWNKATPNELSRLEVEYIFDNKTLKTGYNEACPTFPNYKKAKYNELYFDIYLGLNARKFYKTLGEMKERSFFTMWLIRQYIENKDLQNKWKEELNKISK